MFAAKEKNGIYVSDECFKMATTDAISVACKQLGFGADVYWQGDKTKYNMQEPKQSKSETISPAEIQVLRNLIQKKGLDETKIFKIPIEQLTKEQYVKALKQLEKVGMK